MKEKKVNILVLTNKIFTLSDQYRSMIEDVTKGGHITVTPHRNVTEEMLTEADIIFGWPKEEEINKAVNLSWLHLPSAGADTYIEPNLYLNKDVLLTTSSGVYGMPIAEHVIAMILSYNRNLQVYALLKQEKIWDNNHTTRDFYGSTIGIIGFGDIGNELAIRAKALGARVLIVKRKPSTMPEYVDKQYITEDIDEVLRQADCIVLTLPATEKTKGIISRERLNVMKQDAFLVNIGRGELIDQDALIEALKENKIGGAGLDVMTPEPLPVENPLWELPNVMISQHSSGISVGNDSRRAELFISNLKRYLNKETLINEVDFSEGY